MNGEASERKPLYIYPQDKIDDIVERASEKSELLGVVRNAKGKGEAIRELRTRLPQLFPEIEKLPPAQRTDESNFNGTRFRTLFDSPHPYDFLVAKGLVDLLWEDKA